MLRRTFPSALRWGWACLVACVGAFSGVSAAELKVAIEASVHFDLPDDLAARSLKRFSEQAGREVLFPSSVTRGIRTNRVQGEMPPADALRQMLENTGLVAVAEADGEAYSVRKETPEESKNGQRAAPTEGGRPKKAPHRNPAKHLPPA